MWRPLVKWLFGIYGKRLSSNNSMLRKQVIRVGGGWNWIDGRLWCQWCCYFGFCYHTVWWSVSLSINVLVHWLNASYITCYRNLTPSKSVNASDSSGLLENLVWHPIGNISANNHHVLYLNIGQVDTFPLPSVFLNQNLGPVRLNMAEDLLKNRTEFWNSLPLIENIPCSNCSISGSGSSVEHVHAASVVMCVIIWCWMWSRKRLLLSKIV
jgi:hypothetical protein